MKASAFIVVSGLVQGVGFRYFVSVKAREYGLAGYVRNLPMGDVEIEVEGEKGLIRGFIEDVRRGPRSARVADVRVRWSEELKEYGDFQVKFW